METLTSESLVEWVLADYTKLHTFWLSVFDFFDGNRSSKLNASVVKINFCFWVFLKKFPSVLNFMIDGNPKSWVRFLQTFVTTIWSLQYIFPLYRNLIIISRSSFNNEGQNISTLQHSVQVSMHASVQVIFCQKHSVLNQLKFIYSEKAKNFAKYLTYFWLYVL